MPLSSSPTAASTAPGAARARMRIRQACEPCRKRRRKCDGKLPCGQCSFYQYDCIFADPESDRRTHRTKGNTADQSRHVVGPHRVGGKAPYVELYNAARRLDLPRDNDPTPTQQDANELQNGHSTGKLEQAAPESHDPAWPLLDERKGRYSGRYGTIAFPHLIRNLVGSSAPLRLHSYGWNANVRSELQPPGWSSIRRVITYQEISKYSSIYFEALGPVYDMLDPPSYHERSRMYWSASMNPSPDFEALVAGVVALGSLFSQEPSMAESQLVEYAKTILDIGSCYAPGGLSVDQAAAWVLRTIYLRCTTRPHLAWFASCASLHVAEAIGLHVEQATGKFNGSSARLRILHSAILINGIISAEYGRSRVRIDMPQDNIPDTLPPSDKLALANALFVLEEPLNGVSRLQSLKSIADLHVEHPVLQLHKVDIAMYWYRRHVHGVRNPRLSHSEHETLLDLISTGLSCTLGILTSRYPWWHVASTSFQSLLVLLSIDSDDSLSLVPKAIECLEDVAATFGASLATEAVEASQHLIKALKEKKMAQAHHLRGGDEIETTVDVGNMNMMMNPTDDILPGGTMDDWLEMFDLDADNWLAGDTAVLG